jgi:hypothetical protein
MDVQTLKQIWNDYVKKSGDDIYTNNYIHKSESAEITGEPTISYH